MSKKLTTSIFIRDARDVHGQRYNYDNVKYVGANTPVVIECYLHGPFLQTRVVHILMKCGCPKCGVIKCTSKKLKSTEQFIKDAGVVHGTTYDYTLTVYTNDWSKLSIKCRIHGIFQQKATNHLQGKGCPSCGIIKRGISRRVTHEEFIKKCMNVHSGYYDYKLTKYTKRNEKIIIICPRHGQFLQRAGDHVQGYGCPLCGLPRRYSKKSLRWLNFIQETEKIKIQHAENGGEVVIPGTRFKVDGYCTDDNTIYEFYGDLYHGNPARYDHDCFINFLDTSAGSLYENTKKREQIIEQLGYNIITIWESQWDSLEKMLKYTDFYPTAEHEMFFADK